MKIIYLFSALVLTFTTLFGQQDPKAKVILDKLAQTSKSYKTIQIDFSFSLANKSGSVSETNEGWVALKGKNYRLHMPAMGMEVFSNGLVTWSYMTGSNEVNISENDPNGDASLNPANLFTIYEKGFRYSYVKDESVGAAMAAVIDLFPIDKSKDFTSVRLWVDKSKHQILRAKTFNKDGNVYTLALKNMKTDQALGEDYFKFDPAKHKGVEINDMR